MDRAGHDHDSNDAGRLLRHVAMNAHETFAQFIKMLRNLERFMDKATTLAEAKKFDVNVLCQARLAPDMFPFAKQIQAGCDAAKYAAAYLSGKPAPSHPDTETTMAELRERIAKCVGFVESIRPEDFAGWETRKCAPPWMHGKWVQGDHYLMQLAMPNFYFHTTIAYAILRSNGVDLGKADFIGNLPVKE